MKEKAQSRGSNPNKTAIMAIAGAGEKTRKGRVSGKSEGLRSRFLENLVVKKGEVEEALRRLKDSQKEYKGRFSSDDFIEEVDQAEREISAQTYYSLLERKNRELEKIEILIRRSLEEEEFGRCEECGKRIPEERLLIVPEATRCVPCQREMEKWDLRGKLAEMSRSSPRRKKESRWGDDQDFDEEERLDFRLEAEHTSIMDLEETDLEEPGGEKNEK